jgi:hypothetical protein
MKGKSVCQLHHNLKNLFFESPCNDNGHRESISSYISDKDLHLGYVKNSPNLEAKANSAVRKWTAFFSSEDILIAVCKENYVACY